MRRLRLVAALMATTGLAMMVPAMASAYSMHFTKGHAGTIGWVLFTPPPPGATDAASFGMTFDPIAANSAGPSTVTWVDLPTVPPVTPPSFKFRSTVSSAEGGSTPGLHVRFLDSGRIFMSPSSWPANSWETVDGSGNVWASTGGSCGDVSGITWAAAVACHAGANVTSFLIFDRAIAPGGYSHYFDDVKYGDETFSKPQDCASDPLGIYEKGVVSGYVRLMHQGFTSLQSYDLARLLKSLNCDVLVKLGL